MFLLLSWAAQNIPDSRHHRAQKESDGQRMYTDKGKTLLFWGYAPHSERKRIKPFLPRIWSGGGGYRAVGKTS